MTELARHSPLDVFRFVEELGRRVELGVLSEEAFHHTMNECKFRDADGVYWAVGPESKQWYRYDQGEWRPSDAPPDNLEGPASLGTRVPTTVEELPEEYEEDLEIEDQPLIPGQQAIEQIVGNVRSAYEEGEISSRQAEELLMEYYLIDKEGRFWTAGFHSGGWYFFAERRWNEAQGPPPSESLLHKSRRPCRECGELLEDWGECPQCGAENPPDWAESTVQISVGILHFMSFGMDQLPEPVAEAWDPPAGVPEMPRPESAGIRCPACGVINPTGSRFCNRCGTDLGCPYCGATNPPGSRFCNQCGAALGG